MEDFIRLLKEGPLYEAVTIAGLNAALILWSIQERRIAFDSYCPQCGAATTWRVLAPTGVLIGDVHSPFRQEGFSSLAHCLSHLVFTCARNQSHIARFGIDAVVGQTRHDKHGAATVASVQLTKFGQLPSLADIAASELDAYRAFIDAADLQELNRAVGLAAHGIGIGSFVYLRRIFERLVSEAADHAAAADTNFNRERFKALRMEDKLDAVSGFVPDWMVKNRKLYGILSTGLHELTDDMCMTAFPSVKQATLALLEQHAEEARRKKRASQAAIDLARLGETLAKNNNGKTK